MTRWKETKRKERDAIHVIHAVMARLKLGTGRINITDGGGTHVRSRFVSRRAERDGRIFRRRLFSYDDAAAENENVLLETVQIGSWIFFFVSCLLRASHREQTSFTALGHVPSTERVPVSGVSESRDAMNLTLWRTTRPARFLFFRFLSAMHIKFCVKVSKICHSLMNAQAKRSAFVSFLRRWHLACWMWASPASNSVPFRAGVIRLDSVRCRCPLRKRPIWRASHYGRGRRTAAPFISSRAGEFW